MEPTEAKKWLKSIIRQRLSLVKHNNSHRNKLLMVETCQRLNRLLSAYPYHGASIFGFIRRHYTDILVIIPANAAEKHNCQILNQIALCHENQNTTPTRSLMSEPTQQLLLLQ